MSLEQTGGKWNANVEDIFFSALAEHHVPTRRDLIDEACATDVEHRRVVLSLLKAHEATATTNPNVESEEAKITADAIPNGLLGPSRHANSLGRMGRFEVLGVIAVGGMSVILEALDIQLQRIVVLKVLGAVLCRNVRAQERFHREARAVATIDHENVIKIFAVDQQHGVPYFAMESIHGSTLAARLQRSGGLPFEEVLRIGAQIAHGLAAIHKQGVIHRDLKPENILLELPHDTVKISDFGVALAAEEHHRLTQTGEIHGTPQFMSPEQAQGQTIDQRSDIFSLGAVLYAMAIGASPFEADTPLAALKRVCDDVPQPVDELRSDLPSWFSEMVSQILEKAPQDRLLAAHEIPDLFSYHAARHAASRSDIWSVRIRKYLRRLVITVACVGVLAIAFLIWMGTVTDFSLPLARQLFFVSGAFGHVSIEVDDPAVDFWLIVPTPETQRSKSLEIWLPADVYPIRVYKDGRELGIEHISLDRWEKKSILIETFGLNDTFRLTTR